MDDEDRAPARDGGLLPNAGSVRLGRLARAAGRTALGNAWGRLTGRKQEGWESLDPKAVEELVRTLGELKGLPMKLGQILSFVDETLPPEARRLLAQLQTQSPRLPTHEVERVVRDELGARAEALLRSMSPEPIAAASIGQVHRASLPGLGEVAVKVQYPGIEQAIQSELKLAAFGAKAARALASGADIASYVEEVRERLLEECDYEREASWQASFHAHLSSHPVLRVPAVHELYSSKRVLTSAYQTGMKLERWLDSRPTLTQRSQAGVALYEFYIGSLYRFGLFNADPHPSNYLFDDREVILLDFGCVRRFSREHVSALVALRDAVIADDEAALRVALVGVGGRELRDLKSYANARRLLRAFFAPVLVDRSLPIEPATRSQLGELLRDKRSLFELRLPGDLLFLFRIKFGLYAVLSQLGAEANWHQLELGWRRESASKPLLVPELR